MEKGKRFYGDGLPYVGRYVDIMFDRGFKRIFGKGRKRHTNTDTRYERTGPVDN